MSIALTLLALIVSAVLFYYPYPFGPGAVDGLRYAILALLGLSAVFDVLARFRRGTRRAPESAPEAPVETELPPSTEEAAQAAVVQFVGRLQEKGRFVDFALDDVAAYSNEQVGAAARVVHQGCREVLQEAFEIQPVHGGEEGEEVSLSGEYDASAYRLVGHVPDEPPYRGRVLHRGWRTARVDLPRVAAAGDRGAAREVIAPAEVEVE